MRASAASDVAALDHVEQLAVLAAPSRSGRPRPGAAARCRAGSRRSSRGRAAPGAGCRRRARARGGSRGRRRRPRSSASRAVSVGQRGRSRRGRSPSGAARSSTSRTIRHSIGIRTLNRSRTSSCVSTRDERAAVALALEQALVAERLDRGADRRAGDAELARQVGLGQRRAGLDRAVEDLLAQRDDDGFGGRDRGDGESGHQAATSVRRRRAKRTSAWTRAADSSPLSSPR